MKKLPKRLAVGEHVYKVKPIHADSFKAQDGDDCTGLINFNNHTIRIAVGPRRHPRPWDAVMLDLYHEVFHAVLGEHEEAMADTFATAMIRNSLVPTHYGT